MNEANRNHRSSVADWRKLRDKRPSSLLGCRELRERGWKLCCFTPTMQSTSEMLRARTEWNVIEISLGRDAVVCRRKSGFWSRIAMRTFSSLCGTSFSQTPTSREFIDRYFFGNYVQQLCSLGEIHQNKHTAKIRSDCFAFKKRSRGCLSNLINIQSRLKVILCHYNEEWLRNRLFIEISVDFQTSSPSTATPFRKIDTSWL